MTRELLVVFGWPDGIVTGNLLASLLTLGAAYVFRNPIMRRLVRLHHHHALEHAKRLARMELK